MSPSEGAPLAPPIDCAKALSWVEGDRELFEELIGLLLEDLPARRAALDAAVAAGDATAVQHAVHSLRGGLAPFGAARAAALALEIEQTARDGRLEGTEGALAELARELESVAAFLARPGPCADD